MIVDKAAIKSLASLLFLLILFMYASCSRTTGEMANSDGRMNIVTTTGMIEDIVKNIVKELLCQVQSSVMVVISHCCIPSTLITD